MRVHCFSFYFPISFKFFHDFAYSVFLPCTMISFYVGIYVNSSIDSGFA